MLGMENIIFLYSLDSYTQLGFKFLIDKKEITPIR